MARSAELPGVPLRAKHREQIFKSIAEPLAVIVRKLVDDLEKGAQSLWVAVGQIGVVEDVAEQRRNARIFRHPGDRLSVQIQGLVAAQASAHQLRPAIAGKVAGKKRALPTQLLTVGVNVVHKLVDERDSNLLYLAFRIGHLADEDVAGCVNAAFGSSIEHISSDKRTLPQSSTPPSPEKREWSGDGQRW